MITPARKVQENTEKTFSLSSSSPRRGECVHAAPTHSRIFRLLARLCSRKESQKVTLTYGKVKFIFKITKSHKSLIVQCAHAIVQLTLRAFGLFLCV
jgi:hypothetical protein